MGIGPYDRLRAVQFGVYDVGTCGLKHPNLVCICICSWRCNEPHKSAGNQTNRALFAGVLNVILWEIPPKLLAMPSAIQKKYDARIDTKKRITLRGATSSFYHVTEFSDGSIVLSPRELAHPEEISRKTLAVMDEAVRYLDQGKASEPVDLEELKRLLSEDE